MIDQINQSQIPSSRPLYKPTSVEEEIVMLVNKINELVVAVNNLSALTTPTYTAGDPIPRQHYKVTSP